MNDTDFLPSGDLTAEDALTRDLRAFAAQVRPPSFAPSDVSYVVEDTGDRAHAPGREGHGRTGGQHVRPR